MENARGHRTRARGRMKARSGSGGHKKIAAARQAAATQPPKMQLIKHCVYRKRADPKAGFSWGTAAKK